MARGPSLIQYGLITLAITCTTAISITLVTTRLNKYHSDFTIFVAENRATVQVIVQVLAHTLAAIQLWVVKTLFNYATRISLRQKRLSLDHYGLWSAASQLIVDWTVQKRYIAGLLLAIMLSLVPGALWTGALTPVEVNDTDLPGNFAIPLFTNSTVDNWNSEFVTRNGGQVWNMVDTCKTISDVRGFLPTCPVPGYQGQLLLSASTATPNDPHLNRSHSKFDSPAWSYNGRSYGVGSDVSLINPEISESDAKARSYTFLETGYMANVNCFRNESSELQFVSNSDCDSTEYPLYQFICAMSIIQQNLSDDYPVSTWYNDFSRLLAWKARSYGGKNLISMASGLENYTLFHHIECSVEFKPIVFELFVNDTARTILVSPTSNRPVDIDLTGDLISNVMSSMNLLSRMSNTYYVSVRGEALQNNYLNAQQRAGHDG